MKKLILFCFIISLIEIVSALNLQTVYNPFTGKSDYIRSNNWTGENITANFFIGDGSLLTNINGTWTQATTDLLYVKKAGDTMTGNLSLGNNQLTNVGKLIMTGLITSQNIVPDLDNLYSIGNSTNWFKDIFVKSVYASSINTTNLTSVNINSQTLNSTNITTTIADFGSGTIKKDGDDLIITLT